MNLFAQKYIANRKCIFIYVLCLFVLSLIPLLVITQYNHPSADDFSFGVHTVSAWRETGSFTQTISAAIDGTRHVYNTWQGTFAAVFLMTLHPAVFGEHLYMLGSIVLILGFIAAMMFLLKVILVNYFGADKYNYGIIAMVTTFLSMQFLVSPVEAFYWYNGGMFYTGFHSIAMILFALTLLWMKTDRTHIKVACAILISPLRLCM